MKNSFLLRIAFSIIGFSCLITEASAYPNYRVGIGVGIQHNSKRQIEVVSVAPQSPAQRAKILRGDLILKVDDTEVTGQPLDFVESLFIGDGAEGSFITLDVLTPSTGDERIIYTQRRWTNPVCLIEGPYDLRFAGTLQNGSIWGTIGYASIHWPVYQGRIQEWLNGQYIRLDVYPIAYSNSLEISGWIGSSFIRWPSRGAWFPVVRE